MPQPSTPNVPTFLEYRAIFVLAKWRERITRDGPIALVILLPSECLEGDGINAQLIGDSSIELFISWASVLLDHDKLTSLMVSFCSW